MVAEHGGLEMTDAYVAHVSKETLHILLVRLNISTNTFMHPSIQVRGVDSWPLRESSIWQKLTQNCQNEHFCRQEYSDTVAFKVHGPSKSIFWCPDIDSWTDWDLDVAQVVGSVDLAFLDACFYSPVSAVKALCSIFC